MVSAAQDSLVPEALHPVTSEFFTHVLDESEYASEWVWYTILTMQ